MKGISLP